MKETFCSPDAPSPMGAYSAVIKHGNLVFVSGVGPEDHITHAPKGKPLRNRLGLRWIIYWPSSRQLVRMWKMW